MGIDTEKSESKFSLQASTLAGLGFFLLMHLAGSSISARLALPIPGSVVGLGLALLVFISRRKVDGALREGASILLLCLPLMLVPVGVGICQLWDVHPAGIWKLVAVLLLALALGVICTAKTMEIGLRWRRSTTSSIQPSDFKQVKDQGVNDDPDEA